MKSTYETMGGKYRQVGDYLLPNFNAPKCPKVGVWGERRRKYLREHQKALYTAMLLSGELDANLEAIDRDAEQMIAQLMHKYAAAEGVAEELKAANQLEWVRRMNSVRSRVVETVNAELIYP